MSVAGIGRIALAEKMSVDQLKEALASKSLPAYIAYPLIDEKLDMQERAKAMQAMQQAQQASLPIAQSIDQRMAMASGVDALPSNLPTRGMAGGGIVAFEDGGYVEPIRFQNQGLVPSQGTPFSRSRIGRYFSEQEEIARLRSELKAKYERMGSILPGAFTDQPEGSMAEAQKMVGRIYQMTLPELRAMAAQEMPADVASGEAVDKALKKAGVSYTTDKPDITIPPNATADKSLITPEGAAVIPGQGFKVPAPPTGSAMGIARQFLEGTKEAPGYLARSEEREKKLMEALGKDRLQGQAFGEYEQMLKKEGEQAGLDKEQAKYMALLKAGLSTMAGTSRHAMENIGKGALVGASDYQEAYKDLRKAERERTKEFALIEQARRAEQRDDIKRRDDLLVRANDRADAADRYGITALMNAGIKDQDRAAEIWGKQFSGGITLQAAQIRANALGAGRGIGGGLTQNQYLGYRERAIKEIGDIDQFRSKLAKDAKLSKVPPLGANADFDNRVKKAYENAINERIQLIFGGTGGGSFSNFSVVGTED